MHRRNRYALAKRFRNGLFLSIMKITVMTSTLTGGGAERVATSLASFLAKRGHEVTLLAVAHTDEHYPFDPGVKWVWLREHVYDPAPLKAVRGIHRIQAMLKMFRYVRKSGTEAYVVLLDTPLRVLLPFRRWIRVPVIFSERADPSSARARDQKVKRQAAKFFDGGIFQTEEARKWYAPYLTGPSAVIPNAVSPAFLELPRRDREMERPVRNILTAGRMAEQKNQKMLLRAFAKLKKEYPELTLTICGTGKLENELHALAEQEGIFDAVRMPGYVPDMGTYLQAADLFVLPSDYEGMPNALIEAMAAGLPCIATDCPPGGPRSLIRDGVNGRLIGVGDEEGLLRVMEELTGNPEERDRLGKEAEKIRITHHPDRIYSQWERFITDAVRKAGR